MTCDDTGSNVGLDLLVVGALGVLLLAALLLLVLLVARHSRRRVRRPPARRVRVSAAGDLLDGPPPHR